MFSLSQSSDIEKMKKTTNKKKIERNVGVLSVIEVSNYLLAALVHRDKYFSHQKMRESQHNAPLVQFVALTCSDKQSGCEGRLISERQKEESHFSALPEYCLRVSALCHTR